MVFYSSPAVSRLGLVTSSGSTFKVFVRCPILWLPKYAYWRQINCETWYPFFLIHDACYGSQKYLRGFYGCLHSRISHSTSLYSFGLHLLMFWKLWFLRQLVSVVFSALAVLLLRIQYHFIHRISLILRKWLYRVNLLVPILFIICFSIFINFRFLIRSFVTWPSLTA